MIHRLVWTWIALLALTLGDTAQLSAQIQLASRAPRFVRISPITRRLVDASHATILKRELSLSLERASLAEALDEISRTAGITLIYSRDLVPLETPVTLQAATISLGAALTAVLFDTGLDVVISSNGEMALMKKAPISPVARAPTGSVSGRVTDAKTEAALVGATVVVEGTSRSTTTGNDGRYLIADVAPGAYAVRARYIGYAPGTASVTVIGDQDAMADFTLEKSAQRLDEVVTTGTFAPTEVKALPTPISVISGQDIERQNIQRVDQLFRGQVPGAIAWDQGASNYYSTITVRGANSFFNNSMKTYVDGVEIAFPTYIATIDPNSIERVEITRGPQASTLYGSDATGGVLQIFTKRGQAGLARPELDGKLSFGVVDNNQREGTTLRQDHSLSVLGSNQSTTYGLTGSISHLGEWMPAYKNTEYGVSANARTVQGVLTLSGTARYSFKGWNSEWDQSLRSYTPFSTRPFRDNHLRQQSYGVTADLQASRSWRHSLTLGFDQTNQDYFDTQPRFTTPSDTLSQVFAGYAGKVSLLYHTDVEARLGKSIGAVLTGGANYSGTDLINVYAGQATGSQGFLTSPTYLVRSPSSNTGYFGQVRLDLANTLFVTGGLRAERNANFGRDFGTAFSPRIGASYVRGVGPAIIKLRASYGESVRPPSAFQSTAAVNFFQRQLANPDLGPERQHGWDGGVDIQLGSHASIGVTYYNQIATDLIDQVLVDPQSQPPTYQYENVGRIKNHGWEFEGRLNLSRVQVSGTASIINSVVRALSPTYAGDLQIGDRILGIPRTSGGVTLTYLPFGGTAISGSLTYIGQWREIDWIALYGFYYGGQPFRGSGRDYWLSYPSVTKLALSVSQDLSRVASAFVRVENVGNNLRYESNNATLQIPRTVLVGGRFHY